MYFDTEKFIEEVRKRPCIWDSGLKEYTDRTVKTKCWDELVDIFKEKDDMTAQDKKLLGDGLQRKWKSLRSCFSREMNRQKIMKTGYGCGRKTEYIFFKKLQFLKNVVMQDADQATGAVETAENSQQEQEVIRAPKRIKTKESTVTEDDKFVTVVNRSIQSREKPVALDDDEDKLFMLSLVNTLKRVPLQTKMATKIKIMSILDDATRNELYYDIENPGAPSQAFPQSLYSVDVPMDDNPDSPVDVKPSTISNFSEESSLFDLYD